MAQSSNPRPKKQPVAPSERTSLGSQAAYERAAKGGMTTQKKYRRILSQFKSKGGTTVWLRRGSEYMAEIGRRGGIAKRDNAAKGKKK